MKRSEINRALRDMEKMIDRCSFKLPPFCYFTPEEWNEKGHEYDEVRDNMLGWDITDFGMGDFDKVGFSLITLRNGNVSMDKYTKPYAEKLLYMKEGQSAAMHFHWNKMEDIINRGGGNVLIGVYNAGREEGLADTDVRIHSDGREYTVPAGTVYSRPSLCIRTSVSASPSSLPALYTPMSTFPPPLLMMSSILFQWKCMAADCPSFMYSSFSA